MPKKVPAAELPLVEVTTRAQLRKWLAANAATSPGIWLVRFKKDSGHPHLEYADAVAELLCVGWVDGQAQTVDALRARVLCRPRNPKSGWSAVNKAHVERLEKAGLMRPAGLEAVALAKRNGSWTALDAFESLTVPPDLAKALDGKAPARAHFDAFPPSARKFLLAWVGSAKTPETRTKRINEVATQAKKNVRANLPNPKSKRGA